MRFCILASAMLLTFLASAAGKADEEEATAAFFESKFNAALDTNTDFDFKCKDKQDCLQQIDEEMDCVYVTIDYLSLKDEKKMAYSGDFCMPLGFCNDDYKFETAEEKMEVGMTCPKGFDWVTAVVVAAAVVAAVALAVIGFGLLFRPGV